MDGCTVEYMYFEQCVSLSVVQLRVYAPPDRVEQVDYALNISVRILSRYEELFGVPYMLPKLGTPPMNYIFRHLIKSVKSQFN